MGSTGSADAGGSDEMEDVITIESPPRIHRSPMSTTSRSRRGDHVPGPLIFLDQLVSTEDRPSMAQHAHLIQSIFDDDSSSSSEDDNTHRTNFGFAGPAVQLPPNLPNLPLMNNADLSLRERTLEFYNIWREFNSRHQFNAIPEDPSVVLLYKADFNSNGTSQPGAQIRYLPLVPTLSVPSSAGGKKYMIQPSHQQRIASSQMVAVRACWLLNKMPAELFDEITQHLSRDDIKAMRLVNKEFERGVSRSLFKTVVVPFNTELYDMIEQERTVSVKRDIKGKRRADDPVNNFVDLEPGTLQWKNAMEDSGDKVYRGHGIQVFEGFGAHIRRFGMSFEIKEDALQDPPQKSLLDHVESYFGSYDWPSPEYTRFEKLAGLERTADETSQMKLAFSHLQKVQQLALSVDSGLGWMNGPDRSLRSHILQRPPQVFGCSHGNVDAQQQDRARLWETLETAHRRAGTLSQLREGRLERVNLRQDLSNIRGLAHTPHIHSESWSSVPTNAIAEALEEATGDPDTLLTGVLYVQTKVNETRNRIASGPQQEEDPAEIQKLSKHNFIPASLTKYQKEWLLEAEWAQRAFTTSYMLAIVDNGSVFSRITVFNLARLSSRLMPLFNRGDFWDALPNVSNLTVGVIPDWRTVERDEAGFVETREVDPSQAVAKSYQLLGDSIGPRSSIKKLKFSWAAGGEHAEGIYARNHHVLPAPITILAQMTSPISTDQDMIKLPYVEDLTLSNCWITPNGLTNLVNNLEKASLKKLTLDSVSLTAYPRNIPMASNNAVNHHIAAANGFVPPPIAMGAGFAIANPNPFPVQIGNPNQFPAHFGARIWQGPPPNMPYNLWAQTMLQHMNLLLQQHGIDAQQLPLMFTNHPTGISLQQISTMLAVVATGGPNLPATIQPGVLVQHQQGAAGGNMTLFGQPVAGGGGAAALHQAHQAAHHHQAALHQAAHHHHAAHAAPPTQLLSNVPWYERHRNGSWVKVIDTLSPGPGLDWYVPRKEFDPEPVTRETGLVSIEFVSCGYAQVKMPSFEHGGVEPPFPHRFNGYFLRRQTVLAPAMLVSTDKYLGKVIQYMSEREQEALRFAWGMRMGWSDEKLAEEPEYDGYLPGGTGRFSGVLSKTTPLGAAAHG